MHATTSSRLKSAAHAFCAAGAWVAVAGIIALSAPRAIRAQTVRVSIDTTKLNADTRAALRTWTAYLTARRGWFSSNANTPSPLWVADEQRRWPMYDMASFYLLDGSLAEVTRIEPANVGAEKQYRITTHFTLREKQQGVAAWHNDVTMTVYAVQQEGRWLLANALPRHTATWKRDTVGRLVYAYAPAYRFNRVRAESASTFVDSLADMMNVPRIETHTYYLTKSLDEIYAIIGLESPVKFPLGGLAQPINRQLFAGVPAWGENYRHELAHLVLRPLMTASTSTFVSEGVPTWLGGTSDANYPKAVEQLAAWLKEHPRVTLDSLMRPGYPHPQTYAAAAVVTEMVYDVGGRHGIRLMFDAGATAPELREGLQRITKFGWSRFAQEWRERVRDHEKKDELHQ